MGAILSLRWLRILDVLTLKTFIDALFSLILRGQGVVVWVKVF